MVYASVLITMFVSFHFFLFLINFWLSFHFLLNFSKKWQLVLLIFSLLPTFQTYYFEFKFLSVLFLWRTWLIHMGGSNEATLWSRGGPCPWMTGPWVWGLQTCTMQIMLTHLEARVRPLGVHRIWEIQVFLFLFNLLTETFVRLLELCGLFSDSSPHFLNVLISYL